jgi:hypothetical protein
MNLKRAFLAAVFAAVASAPRAAEPTPSPSSTQDLARAALVADIGPMPSDAAVLDGYVSREDWAPLIEHLTSTTTADEVLRDLNWERSKVVNGGNFLFDITYVNALWRAANSQPAPTSDQLRQNALAFALYGLALIDLDGPRCKDPTAPAQKLALAETNWAVIIRYGQSLPPQEREKVKQVALRLEWATAPVRANDPILCRSDAAEIQANSEAAAQPEYLAETLWKSKVDARRAKLPEAFDSLLNPPAAAGAPPSAPTPAATKKDRSARP